MCTHVVKEKTKCSLILVGESIYARCMLVNGRGSIRTTEYLFGLYRRVIPRNDVEELINEKNLSPSTSIFQEEGDTPLDVDKGQQYQHFGKIIHPREDTLSIRARTDILSFHKLHLRPCWSLKFIMYAYIGHEDCSIRVRR